MIQRRNRVAKSFALAGLTLLSLAFSLPLAAEITCGKGDGPGKVYKHRTKDPNDPTKTLEWYCVDEAYFKIEVKCGDKTTCFATCVFDGGHNVPIPFPGPGGWTKVIWYNWDKVMCGVHWMETVRKPGETPQQQADRVRQLLIDKGCDFNCYTWTPTKAKRARRPDGRIRLDVFRDGQQVESMLMPPRQVDFLFGGGHPSLVQDPAMFETTALGQASADGESLLDEFDAGTIDARYSALPGSDPLALVGDSLYFNIAQAGDGLYIDVADRTKPMCLKLDGLDIAPFATGDGFGILLEFEGGDSTDLQFYQTNSVRVKAVEKKADGTTTEVIRTVEGIDLKDIASIQIDWVPMPGHLLDRIEIEIMTKDGKKIGKKFRSGFKHDAGRTTAYRIRGLDITTDPPILIDRIFFSDVHTDAVDGFTANLHVDQLAVLAAARTTVVGQTGTIDIVAIGPSGDPLPEREIVFLAESGGIAFTNPFGLLDPERREVTLKTNADGRATASYLALQAGSVEVQIVAEDGQAVATVPVMVQPTVVAEEPGLRP